MLAVRGLELLVSGCTFIAANHCYRSVVVFLRSGCPVSSSPCGALWVLRVLKGVRLSWSFQISFLVLCLVNLLQLLVVTLCLPLVIST